MSKMKNELSVNSENYISKERYLELVHFCLQYAEWKRAAKDLLYFKRGEYDERAQDISISNPVLNVVIKRERYLKKIKLVEDTCREVSEECYPYLLAAVAYGYTYASLCAKYDILPCGENKFYKLRRKVYKVLDDRM